PARFLLRGDPRRPVEYRVRRVRDGRRFAQRQVSAWQRGREILLATVSFTAEPLDAPGHQHETMPAVAGPEALGTELDHRRETAHPMRPQDRPWPLIPPPPRAPPGPPPPLPPPPP